jgi:hypothetical protein
LRMVTQGWEGDFRWAYTSQAAPALAAIVSFTFGFVLAALALIGAAGSIRRPAQPPIFACMAAYAVGIFAFQAFVPTGVEARKLMMAFPAILFLAAAGARQLAELLRGHVRPAWTAAALIGLGTVLWSCYSLTMVHRDERGYRAVAQYILSNPALKNAVILVSSNEPAIGEGMLIAEIASRESRPGHFILRASKVISHSDWSGELNYRLLVQNPNELLRVFDEMPVNVVVAEFPFTPQSPPHHRLLLDAIEHHPDRWSLMYTGTDPSAPGGSRKIGVFVATATAPRHDLRLKIDLTETLGRTLQTGYDF